MKPLHLLSTMFSAALLAACATPQMAAPSAAPPVAAAPAQSLQDLVAQVDIPYETFTLPNGLTTIVHTDRKAPIVGVTTYYRVGSKNEPRGRTGFAHLFEHIMFNGSENVDNFDIPLEGAGSTSTNGSTSFDRTNYVETVPTGALDLALMMESDRMGYLLGALTQEDLDRQRGVVKNEKRQGDNQPYGLEEYLDSENLLPVGHPYRHNTIGSMADLDAASLEDVRNWFTSNYAPNNVVLVLTGDIDLATARAAVERWYGDIPSGPAVVMRDAGPVTLPAPVDLEITDQVSQTQVVRSWTGPGLTDPDTVPLEVGMYILGGLQSSRLDRAMVYESEAATSVSAWNYAAEQISFLQAQFNLAPEVDRAAAQSQFDAEIARMIAEGPSAEEVQRAATQLIAGQIGSLEHVGDFGGKGEVLAEGLLYTGDPAFYRTRLQQIATVTPQQIRAAMQRWLTRPAFTLTTVPGERTLDGGPMGGWGDEDTNPPPAPDAGNGVTAPRSGPPRSFPATADVGNLNFPQAQRATLSNGLSVTLVERPTVPTVTIALSFDSGSAVDSLDEAGRQQLMMDMLSEGTTSRSAIDIVTEQEDLGATVSANTSVDASRIYLSSLTSNLPQSLDLMADMTLHPAFAEDDFDRLQAQRVAEIEEERTSPGDIAGRAFGRLVFGDQNPYAMASSTGDLDVVQHLTTADMRAEHAEWVRPDIASFTVVGDISMGRLLPLLEQAFGNWTAPATPPSPKATDLPIPAPRPRLVVIDRPNSPQSLLLMGRVLPLRGTDGGTEALDLANEVLGNGFLSRMMSDLRETRGWTYGVSSSITNRVAVKTLVVSTAVQSDRTGDSIRVLLDQMNAFPSTRPVDTVELQRVTDGNVRGLPNRFETNGQILSALLGNEMYDRPADYQEHLPAIYRAVDADAIDAAAAQYLQASDLTIVVVGDRAQIDAQMVPLSAEMGLEIEYLRAEEL